MKILFEPLKLQLSKEEISTLMKNAFEASWLTDEEKEEWKKEVDRISLS